jgi:hypothetical protein
MHNMLGYARFAAQGGDWGAFIASRLGHAHPETTIGIHLNLLAARHPIGDRVATAHVGLDQPVDH